MEKQKSSKWSIAFYVFAVIFLAFTVYMIYSSVTYLKSYAESYGTSLGSMKKDVFQYICQQALPYLFYAACAFGIGKILSIVSGGTKTAAAAGSTGTAGSLAAHAVSAAEEALDEEEDDEEPDDAEPSKEPEDDDEAAGDAAGDAEPAKEPEDTENA